jgi:hypothetical protein
MGERCGLLAQAGMRGFHLADVDHRSGALSHLEVHHQELRSQSGDDAEQNLITLCTRCHAIVHRGCGNRKQGCRPGNRFGHLRNANARTPRPWLRVTGRIADTGTGSHELCQPFLSYAAAYSHRSLPPASVEYEQPRPRRRRVWTSPSEPCTLLISTQGGIYA